MTREGFKDFRLKSLKPLPRLTFGVFRAYYPTGLFRSNQIQGNLTVEELLELMRAIVAKHDIAYQNNNLLEEKIRKLTPKL